MREKHIKIKKHKEKSKLIVSHEDKLLVLQNESNPMVYRLFGGSLKKSESPEEALIRELFEEAKVKLSKQSIAYHRSTTIDLGDKQRLTKHYFLYKNNTKPFMSPESLKLLNATWLAWEDTLKFLEKSDKKIVKELFKPCTLNC
ncbi:NUDIX domain-containing protein [uncultured Dokdonia sp.]|uniref:NUDIX hydrolase n=1 Tax=uncultured Dokdonia sp. TaxID=575653 RepID=UPI002616AA36|nr:NUDIX domain-containing protein [uncultured Dokdonia sp.]